MIESLEILTSYANQEIIPVTPLSLNQNYPQKKSTIELFVGRIKSVLLRIISKLSWKMSVILESGFKSM